MVKRAVTNLNSDTNQIETSAGASAEPGIQFTTTFNGVETTNEVALSPASANRANIEIHPEKEYQKIIGFGPSMTFSSAVNLLNCEPETQQKILEDLFDKDKGAGINFLRLCVGASDYAIYEYSYQDHEQDKFSIKRDKLIIDAIKLAQKIQPNLRFIACPWTAPPWMKSNNSYHGGSLKQANYQKYADYFVKFIREYEKVGIKIDYISLQNEPLYETAPYPCMRMTADNCIGFLKVLGPTFERENIKTKIMIYDHNVGDAGLAYVRKVYNSEAGKWAAGSAWHYYSDPVKDPISKLSSIRKDFPDKEIYFTERTTMVTHNAEIPDGIKKFYPQNFPFMLNIFMQMLEQGAMCCSSWNLALNKNNGPMVIDPTRNRAGTVQIDHEKNVYARDGSYSPYALTKFIPTDSKRINSVFNGLPTDVTALAFKDPSDNRITLLCQNKGNSDRKISLKCGNWETSVQLTKQSACSLNLPSRITLSNEHTMVKTRKRKYISFSLFEQNRIANKQSFDHSNEPSVVPRLDRGNQCR